MQCEPSTISMVEKEGVGEEGGRGMGEEEWGEGGRGQERRKWGREGERKEGGNRKERKR